MALQDVLLGDHGQQQRLRDPLDQKDATPEQQRCLRYVKITVHFSPADFVDLDRAQGDAPADVTPLRRRFRYLRVGRWSLGLYFRAAHHHVQRRHVWRGSALTARLCDVLGRLCSFDRLLRHDALEDDYLLIGHPCGQVR